MTDLYKIVQPGNCSKKSWSIAENSGNQVRRNPGRVVDTAKTNLTILVINIEQVVYRDRNYRQRGYHFRQVTHRTVMLNALNINLFQLLEKSARLHPIPSLACGGATNAILPLNPTSAAVSPNQERESTAAVASDIM